MTAFISAFSIDMAFRQARPRTPSFTINVVIVPSRAFDLFLLDGIPALFRIGLALLQVPAALKPMHSTFTVVFCLPGFVT
jgi:hypothetical protein